MAILRFKKEPTPVVFREGISGKETASTRTGEREWQHFCNQHNGQKDTIYLPEEAEAQLQRLAPRQSETVLIAVAKINGEMRWFLKIAESSDAQEPAPAPHWSQPPAPPPPPPPPPPPQRIQPAPGEHTHALQYPPAASGQERQIMAAALVNAIEAARMAERATGVAFGVGDYRSIGISMYIEACKLRAAIHGQERAA